MAKNVIDNVTRHVSGKLVAVTFTREGNELVAGYRRRVRRIIEPTEAQTAAKERFRDAGRYARSALKDPVVGPVYREIATEQHRRVFAVAASDWFQPPEVVKILPNAYRGIAGDRIEIDAKDDVKVVSIDVSIHRASDGSLIERGMAVLVEGQWFYTTTEPVDVGEAVVISATARDLPGHEGSRSLAYTAPAAAGTGP